MRRWRRTWRTPTPPATSASTWTSTPRSPRPSAAGTTPTGALKALSFAPTRDASAGATRADGSTVDVDSESAKLAANALEQQAAVQVAHARIGILKAAMGTGT